MTRAARCCHERKAVRSTVRKRRGTVLRRARSRSSGVHPVTYHRTSFGSRLAPSAPWGRDRMGTGPVAHTREERTGRDGTACVAPMPYDQRWRRRSFVHERTNEPVDPYKREPGTGRCGAGSEPSYVCRRTVEWSVGSSARRLVEGARAAAWRRRRWPPRGPKPRVSLGGGARARNRTPRTAWPPGAVTDAPREPWRACVSCTESA